MTRPIAISDSANFYVSAERIFDPTLKNVPVIVLSNNDRCAVARSDEAKALGIKMGEPLHLLRDKIEAHGIRVFSSNYTLYGDISRRVVEVYEDYSPSVEIYSIDECFLDFSGFKDRTAHAKALRRDVLRRVGVPVRVGIAPTKTLAKCANDIAKKNPIFAGVLDMMDDTLANWLLPLVPVGDIWGIGRKTQAKLHGVGIGTAAELRDMPLRQARALGTVVLERTVLELQGEPCIAFDDVEPQRKGMAVTRSSGTPMKDFDTVFEAITAHATRAAEKLRRSCENTDWWQGQLPSSSTPIAIAKTDPSMRDPDRPGSPRCRPIPSIWLRPPRDVPWRPGRRSVQINTGLRRPVSCSTICCPLTNGR